MVSKPHPKPKYHVWPRPHRAKWIWVKYIWGRNAKTSYNEWRCAICGGSYFIGLDGRKMGK